MITLQPGFLKYHQEKNTAKDGPRVGASPVGRVKKSVVHAPTEPRAIHAMPIVAVIGAIVSISAGVAAVGAATTVIGMVVAGAMIVGGALTLVGVATGNEKLMKIGGILSLAGGAASAFGAGSAMSGVSSAGAGTIEAAEAGLTAAEATQAGMAGGGFNSAGAGLDAAGLAVGDTAAGIGTTAAETGNAANAAASPGILESNGTEASNAFSTGTDAQSANPLGSKTAFDVPTTAQGNSAFQTEGGGILDWMNNNKTATEQISGLVKGAAGAVPTAKDKALVNQANANTGLTNEQAEQLRRRAAYAQGKLYVKGG